MVNIYSNSGQINYGIKTFILDDSNDFDLLVKDNLEVGSSAFVIGTSQYFMLGSDKEWHLVELNNNMVPGGTTPLKELTLLSSDQSSVKRFKITINDQGVLQTQEIIS